MATAPKAVPKAVPKAGAPAEAPEAAPVKKSSKKLFIIIGAALLVLGGAGGGAWYYFGQDAGTSAHPAPAKHEPAKPPVFVVLEQFTVNLTSEGTDQFLQVSLTLQVGDQVQVDLFKQYMPLVRSRLLLLLSTKKASELSTADGKKKLTDEIIALMKQPFAPHSPPQSVSNVFFTSFVIQ